MSTIPQGKRYTAKIKLKTFASDPKAGIKTPLGVADEGDYLGDFISREKQKGSDSYWWKFNGKVEDVFNKLNKGVNPYYILAEEDELNFAPLKVDPVGKAGAKVKDKVEHDFEEAFKKMSAFIVKVVAALIIGFVIEQYVVSKWRK